MLASSERAASAALALARVGTGWPPTIRSSDDGTRGRRAADHQAAAEAFVPVAPAAYAAIAGAALPADSEHDIAVRHTERRRRQRPRSVARSGAHESPA